MESPLVIDAASGASPERSDLFQALCSITFDHKALSTSAGTAGVDLPAVYCLDDTLGAISTAGF